MLIFKLLRPAEWAAFETSGATDGAPVDVADGFVHLSTAEQLPETLARHFIGEAGLVLVAIEAEAAGPALAWESSRGGALFPHLYRRLTMDDVVWARPVADGLP